MERSLERAVQRFEKEVASAEARLEAGFTSKSAKQEVLSYGLGRAYDELQPLLPYEWNMPYGLHQWRAKHAEQAKVRFPAEVKMIEKLVALRAQVVAAPLVAKQRSAKVVAKELEKARHAKTCQICARQIFAELGVIAHHGYERPGHGWQTQSCSGARELPFEVSRERLGVYNEMVRQRIVNMKSHLAAVRAESKPLNLSYEIPQLGENGKQLYRYGRSQYETVRFELTRGIVEVAKAAHPKFFRKMPYNVVAGGEYEYLKEREIASVKIEIKNWTGHLNEQVARYEGWKQSFEWKNGEWVKFNA